MDSGDGNEFIDLFLSLFIFYCNLFSEIWGAGCCLSFYTVPFCTIAQFDTAQCYGYYDDESPILTEDNCEIDNCFLRFTRNINYV